MMLIVYYLLIHAKVLHVSLLWRCQLSKLQADVQHKYKLSVRLSSAFESLYHALFNIIYADTPKCDRKLSCIFRGSTKGRLWVVLLCLQCQSFFVYRILGTLQRCDHKLAVLTEGDFEQFAFFFFFLNFESLARNLLFFCCCCCQSRSRLERVTVRSARPTEFM